MSPYSSVYFVICLQFISESLPYSDMRYPKYLKSVTCSIILSFITISFKNGNIKTGVKFWILLAGGSTGSQNVERLQRMYSSG